MESMCPRGYHNGSVAYHAFRHMMYGCNIVHHVAQVHELPKSHCSDNQEGTLF